MEPTSKLFDNAGENTITLKSHVGPKLQSVACYTMGLIHSVISVMIQSKQNCG